MVSRIVVFAGITILFSQNLVAQSADVRSQWLSQLGELLSYNIALEHLRQGKCQNHYPNNAKVDYMATFASIRDRFPTELGKLNFLQNAKFALETPEIVAIFKSVRKSIDDRTMSSIENAGRLEDVCLSLIDQYIKLKRSLLPRLETSIVMLLKTYPDGFKIGESN